MSPAVLLEGADEQVLQSIIVLLLIDMVDGLPALQ